MTFKVKDYYYKKAKDDNFLARSIYKLEEIDQRYKILKKGDSVLDLGYYPGSWLQYVVTAIGPKGTAVGIDLKPVQEKLLKESQIKLFERDCFTVDHLEDLGVSKAFNVVLSDMAPNTTGVRSVDQARSLDLVEKVFGILPKFLERDGHFVIKVFESQDAQSFFKDKKDWFNELSFLRPKSTRSVSKEYFVIGKGFKKHEV
jgi:23S rRNA (uridine2552-2'-O)-methyltransferase